MSIHLERDIAIYALQQGWYPLYDANTSVNQCHVVSTHVAELAQKKSLTPEEQHFLVLCLKTSSLIAKEKDGWEQLYHQYRKDHPYSSMVPKADREKERQAVHKYSKMLPTEAVQNGLKQELEPLLLKVIARWVTEEPELAALCSNPHLKLKGQHLRTYPKYPGLLAVGMAHAQTPLPIVIKLKCWSGEKSSLLTAYAPCWHSPVEPLPHDLELDQPALVIEGVRILTPATYPEYVEKIKQCTHQLLTRHRDPQDDESCTCWSYEEVRHEWSSPLTVKEWVEQVGASFQENYQEQLPLVRPLQYTLSLQKAEEQGSSYKTGGHGVIEHIHLDRLGHALSLRGRLIDLTPKQAWTATLNRGSA